MRLSRWPKSGLSGAATIAPLLLIAVISTWVSARHVFGAGPGASAASPPDRHAAVATRVITTALIDLEVKTIALRALDERIEARAGAILSLDDRVLVADANGAFWEVSQLDGSEPRVRPVPLKLQLNRAEHIRYFRVRQGDGQPGEPFPPRVTGLLHLGPGPRIAVSYAHWNPDQACLTQRVSTVTVPPVDQPGSGSSPQWHLLYTTQPCLPVRSAHETGGRMLKTGPHTILLTVGHFAGRYNSVIAKEPDVHLGKLIELDVETGASRVFTSGHRNAQGLTRDRTGRIWLTEHGQQGGDELNLVREGRNYGWPFATLGTDYGARSWPLSSQQGRHRGFEEPVYAWIPDVGIGHLIELERFHERWDGDLLALSLKAQSLHRLRLSGDHVVYEERIRVGERLRDIARSDDGALILWTDSASLLRVSALDDTAPVEPRISRMGSALREALLECARCHGMSRESGAGDKISLWAVTGKQAARGRAKLYSKAMLAKRPVWNDQALSELLVDPQAFVPGTTMNFGGIADVTLRQDVIEFLKTLR